MSKPLTTPGRKANAAEPLGEKTGVDSKAQVERTGRKARKAAGPDGPDAGAVGDALKRP